MPAAEEEEEKEEEKDALAVLLHSPEVEEKAAAIRIRSPIGSLKILIFLFFS